MFNDDLKQEQRVVEILYDIFFKEYMDKYNHTTSRLAEKNDLGITATIMDEETKKVAIKAQVNQYINNPTSTFCLELSYMGGTEYNAVQKGWFIDTKLETTHYLFVWIHDADVYDGKLTQACQLYDVELMMVSRADIKDYLLDKGFGVNDFIEMSNKMRTENKKVCTKNGIKFVCSTHLPEKPVNVIISKSIYRKLPSTKVYRYKKGLMTLG